MNTRHSLYLFAIAFPDPRSRNRMAFALGAAALFGPWAVAAAQPNVTKKFAVRSILVTETTTLTFDLVSGIGNALTGVSFTDPLPPGIVVATPNGPIGACGGVTTVAGSNAITLTNGTDRSRGGWDCTSGKEATLNES